MQEKEKFKWGKFILDCFLCFGILIISPFVFFYPIQWFFGLYPIQWIVNSYPIQWIVNSYPIQWFFGLYPIQWFFDIGWIEPQIIFWFALESAIALSIINFFYKIHKLSLLLSLVFVIYYGIFACYFFSHGR